MKGILIGSILAALAAFIWGFIFWNLLPFRNSVVAQVPDEAGLAQALQERLPASGTYQIPDVRSAGGTQGFMDRSNAGPIAQVMIRKEGGAPANPGMMLNGFIHYLLTAVLIGIFLNMALPAAGTYGARFMLVLVAGIAAAVFAHLLEPIWFFRPWNWGFLRVVHDITTWAVMGLVLARFVRP